MKNYILLLFLLSCTSSSLVVGAAQEYETEFEDEKWTVEKIGEEHRSFAYALRALISSMSKEIYSPNNESVLRGHLNVHEAIVNQDSGRYTVSGDLYKITNLNDSGYNYPILDRAHKAVRSLKRANRGYDGPPGMGISYYYNTEGKVRAIFSHTTPTPALGEEIWQTFLRSSCNSFYFFGIVDGPGCDDLTFDIDDFSLENLVEDLDECQD